MSPSTPASESQPGRAGKIKHLYLRCAPPEGREPEYVPRFYFEAKIDLSDVRSGFHDACSVSKAMEIFPVEGDAIWTRDMARDIDPSSVESGKPQEGILHPLPPFINEETVARMEGLFLSYLLRYFAVKLYRNPALNVYSHPGEGLDDFRNRCRDLMGESMREDLDALQELFQRKLEQAREKCLRQSVELPSSEDLEAIRTASHWKSKIHEMSERIAALFLKSETERSCQETPAACRFPAGAELDELLHYIEVEARQQILELLNRYQERVGAIDEYTVHPNVRGIHLVRSCILWVPEEPQS